jgi:hypothetical protein
MSIQDLIPPSVVPAGKSGDWRVIKRTVSKKEADHDNFMMLLSGAASRQVKPGKYTVLLRGNQVVMSDTPAEVRDHVMAAHKATGHVLINGLGIGLIARACLLKKDVKSVTVIELSPDVIKLTSKHIKDPRLTIIQADAYTWQPPKEAFYDVVWHDIWDTISPENLKLMGKLHRKYARRCGWQGSWAQDICRIMQRQDREGRRRFI